MLASGTLLVLLAAVGLPLFVVLGAAGLLAMYASDLDPALLIVEMNRLAASPNLLALPLFTLAGVTLAHGGAAQRITQLFNGMFGWMPGGLAIVAIASCAFFTAFSGASGVTILALGGLLYPMLQQAGYPQRFSLGLLTSSGSLGLMFPPSLPILLYGIVAGVSIDQVFLAGIVPGLLLMLILGLYCLRTGVRAGVPRQRFSGVDLAAAMRQGVWDLLLPVGIIGGIVGGIVTVTESAALTACYVLLLETVVHRNIRTRRALLAAFTETSVLVGSILVILGVAMGLTNIMIDAQVPMRLLAWMQDIVTSPVQFLLLLNLFLLLVGCVMDIFSAIVVLVPLLVPLASRYGVDPVHLGIIFLANLEIGYSTPPVGLNLFIASQRFGKSLLTLFAATLPYIGLMLLWLALVTYVPLLSLWWRD